MIPIKPISLQTLRILIPIKPISLQTLPNIDTNKTNIATNASNIDTNKTNIATNASNIQANSRRITRNASGIQRNKDNINNLGYGVGVSATALSSPQLFPMTHQSPVELARWLQQSFLQGDLVAPRLNERLSLNVGGSHVLGHTIWGVDLWGPLLRVAARVQTGTPKKPPILMEQSCNPL
ncbi:MAG: hypothetical protein CM15mP39_08050 [Synechococcus sp.]|nr:MAG: hypothetical protein CM15mP39_08050 [Synechococcus sp.]